MDLYGQKSKSIPQKIVIVLLELAILWLSYWILFQKGGSLISNWMGIKQTFQSAERRTIIFTFSIIVFLRIGFMMLYLMKRKIPWEESVSIPLAFALYYIGFALFVLPTDKPIDYIDYFGIFLFTTGSFLNTYGEIQRGSWKKKPENKGRLYTIRLFKYSMHINFFGDLLWVSGYAVITRNYYAVLIPILLFCMFAFYNIPKLDHYLANKYGAAFEEYAKKTKRFIPFIY